MPITPSVIRLLGADGAVFAEDARWNEIGDCQSGRGRKRPFQERAAGGTPRRCFIAFQGHAHFLARDRRVGARIMPVAPRCKNYQPGSRGEKKKSTVLGFLSRHRGGNLPGDLLNQIAARSIGLVA